MPKQIKKDEIKFMLDFNGYYGELIMKKFMIV